MRRSEEEMARALALYDEGHGAKAIGLMLGIPKMTVRKWVYAYRAIGKEALDMQARRTYDHETKVAAARAVVEGGMSRPEAMEAFGIRGIGQISAWCRLYREGGPDALLPKRRGRPKKAGPAFASREEELEARVRELELELEIQKRINALADEIERRRQTR